MTPDDLSKLIASVEGVVKSTVNGKIDRIQKTLDESIVKHEKMIEANSKLIATNTNLLAESNKRVVKLEDEFAKLSPILDTYNNLGGFRKTLISASIFIGSIAGLGFGLSQVAELLSRLRG